MGLLQPPNGNFFILLQGLSSISQSIYLDAGTYTLSWSSVGWTAYNTTQPIQVHCNDKDTSININDASYIYIYTPLKDAWKTYSTEDSTENTQKNINISKSGNYTIGFSGTFQTEDGLIGVGIKNITLTNISLSSTGTYTYDSCKQESINNGYQYFALQDVDKEKKLDIVQ